MFDCIYYGFDSSLCTNILKRYNSVDHVQKCSIHIYTVFIHAYKAILSLSSPNICICINYILHAALLSEDPHAHIQLSLLDILFLVLDTSKKYFFLERERCDKAIGLLSWIGNYELLCIFIVILCASALINYCVFFFSITDLYTLVLYNEATSFGPELK